MGVTATPKSKDGAYWTHSERKKFEGFDHHAFYVGYDLTNVVYSAMKTAKGIWGLAPRKNFHNFPAMLESAALQTWFK